MKMDIDYDRYPNILVVSNNSFSTIKNNGKTLDSFFDEYPTDKVAQLYFNGEEPNGVNCNRYYQITDRDVLTSLSKKDINCGRSKTNKNYEEALGREVVDNNSIVDKLKCYDSARIVRELAWKFSKWNNTNLNNWLDEFKPELIFFCAGDSGFAYDILEYIKEKYDTKLVVYITDDYILPRKKLSLAWWMRRNYIFNKMKNCIIKSDLFLTISEQMQREYKKQFNKDSVLAVNMTESMKSESFTGDNESNNLNLVYAGGLHYKRYITLSLLASAIKKYNRDLNNKKKAFLNIYSSQKVDSKLLKYLDIEGASKFCGSLNSTQLKKILNRCDIPVHVESFNQNCIESTKLSISTKIPEYLSLEKPILAIGPSEVASMKYLKDVAFCITNDKKILSNLTILFNDCNLMDNISKKALDKFEKNHKKEIISRKIIMNLLDAYEGKYKQ